MKVWIGFLLGISLLLASCHSNCDHDHEGHDHSGHDHGDHSGHDHGSEKPVITYTLEQEATELFLEFAPFVVNQSNKLHIVVTNLETIKPIEAAVTVHIKGISKSKAKKLQTGVYEAPLSIKNTKPLDLIVVIDQNGKKQSFTLNQLPVAKDDHDMFHVEYPNADVPGSISFVREQAWITPLEVTTAKTTPVGNIIHSSGLIQPSSSDLSSVVAKSAGIVTIRKKNMTNGTAVRAGELLFTVTGKGIVEDDLEMNYIKAQSTLDRESSNLERKKKLLEDNIIGQKEYDQILNQYELAKAEYDNIEKLFAKGKKRHLVTTTTSGFVSQLLVQEGQFVKAGQPLASILKTSRVQIKIDVSPRYRAMLPSVVDANFVNPYNNNAYSLSDLEGKVISFGRMTSHEEGHYIPMFFEINNHPDLAPGALIEAYLLTQTQHEQLTIPNSAILEEMGSYVVFVQKSAETFEKQVIEKGTTDGKVTQVLKGLKAGDKVIAKGGLQIKLASMNNVADPHAGHNH